MSSDAPIFRPMTVDDLPAVIALWRQTEGVGLLSEETEPMLARYLDRNPGLSAVAVDGAGVVIGAVLAGHDGRRGFLYHLAVAQSCRGHGIGRSLVESCVTKLRACGLARVSIMVYATNAEGRAFWEHLGWKSRDDLRAMQITF